MSGGDGGRGGQGRARRVDGGSGHGDGEGRRARLVRTRDQLLSTFTDMFALDVLVLAFLEPLDGTLPSNHWKTQRAQD